MTVVRVDLRTPDGSPATGVVTWTPTRRRAVEEHVVLPAPVMVDLTDGVAQLDVDATGAGWAWRVVERVASGGIRYVQVPDAAGPVEYVDLVDVDPTTLDPAASPDAAWAIEAATHTVADTTYTEAPAQAVIRRRFDYAIATSDPDLWLNLNEAGQRMSSLNEWGALRGFATALPWYDSLVRAIRQDSETTNPGGTPWVELEDRRTDAEVRTLWGSRWADGLPVQRDAVVGTVFTIHPWEALADVPSTLAPGTLVAQRDGEAD